jgi:hypothetical protein
MGKDANQETSSPPTVIRGRDSQKGPTGVGLHWFRGSFPTGRWSTVFTYLTELFGEPEHSDFALWHYDACMTWPNGTRVRYHTQENRYHLTGGRFALECPGEVLAAMEPLRLIDFLEKWAYEFAISISRLDERMLDYEWVISPLELASLVTGVNPKTKEVTKRDFTGFEVYDENFPRDSVQLTMAEVTFGRRGSLGSGSYLRFYDKELESKGDIPAACWELESSGDKARTRFQDILTAVKWARATHEDPVAAMATTIGQHIGGCIDFIHRDQGDKNLARCPRWDFWSIILDKLGGRLTWVTETAKKTVERAKSYVFRQVVPTLQMLKEALTPDRFWEWIEKECVDGVDRLRAVHRRAIAEYQGALAVGMVLPADTDALFRAFHTRHAPRPLTEDEVKRYCR